MKVQISFDVTDLEKALSIAKATAEHADALEIGSLLLYKYGIQAITEFKTLFPEKELVADAKIVDGGKQAATLLAQAGAHAVTVMAGAGKAMIHTVSTAAHTEGCKVILDLFDACSLGQSALEAKSVGVDALLLHRPHEGDPIQFLDTWDMVKGNSSLPIYITGRITRDVLDKIIALKPDGVVISRAITDAENPQEEAAYFKDILSR